jgi:cytidine deaminase
VSARAPLDDETTARLLEAAKAAQQRAYAPYSGFPVGAAVLTDAGEVFEGCNVENASFGLTICAERVAVLSAVAAGARKLRAVGLVTVIPATPCGACRQVLNEFGPDLDVIMAGPDGQPEVVPLRELLPRSFGPDDLQRAGGQETEPRT